MIKIKYYNSNMKISYIISSRPYYDSMNQTYCNILAINREPIGPLQKLVTRINQIKLSDFQTFNNDCCDSSSSRCFYGLKCINGHGYMTIDNISDLFTFLVNNGYHVDTSLTKVMRECPIKTSMPLICMVSYEYNLN
jgi:hypothetical protein